jgi:sugar phosphate isomerase/epimerase
MAESLTTYLPKVKARVSPNQSFGVSLRLSAASADTLVKDRAARDQLKDFLARNDMYLYTVNAFPYGAFKGTTVKEQVYEPDWRSDARARYTMNVADILAEVAPAAVMPSIQTPPLGFKPRVTGPEVVDEFTRQLLGVTAHLVELERQTGKTVTLAIEPEPYCYLETTDETVRFFQDHMYSGASASSLARLSGLPIAEAHMALRKHVGTVFDICHQAVEFEDIAAALQKLTDAGVPIFKLQEAAAMRVPLVTQELVDTLKRYTNTIYLTQTIEKKDGRITRFLNLEDAFKAWERDPGPREWRIHFHVPVFLDDLGQFKTTRFAIEEALKVHKKNPQSRQLEIETYTWDVLPDHLKTGDIVDYVCREIEWVKAQLV